MAKKRHIDSGRSITSIGARLSDDQGLKLAATSRPQKFFTIAPRPHTDDIAVDQLAIAMKAKLAKKRMQGFSGWDNPLECSVERLSMMMAEMLCKGDPVDVANIAAMLLSRGADHRIIAEHAMRAFLQGSCHDQSARIAALELLLAAAKQEARA